MAKVSRKVLREELRTQFMQKVSDYLTTQEEEVLTVGSGKIAIPVCDREGNEEFVTITFSVPTGSRADNEPYDGYGEAESYKMKLEANAKKAEEKEKKKAEKIKRDAEFRRKKEQIKQKGKA